MAKINLEDLAEKLVKLNIVTAVGGATVSKGEGGKPQKLAIGDGAKILWTSIDLFQGDITTVIPEDCRGEAGKDLREFHLSREQQGLAIIKSNIEALEKLFKLISDQATKKG